MGFFRKLTGADAAKDAAKKGAAIQSQLGQQAINLQQSQQEQIREDLLPFITFGAGLIPEAQQLFGAGAGEAVVKDPAFQALADEAERRLMASQAARGRFGAGDTPIMLQDALLRTGTDLLSRQRGDLLSALGLGQSSAAHVGSTGAQSAALRGDLLTQIANAQAGGLQGQAMAKQQGFQDLMQGGAMIAGLAGLCDRRAKRNITPYGKFKDHNTYKFQYKHRDEWFVGPMADEVKAKNPNAIITMFGYDHVNFGAL